MVKLKLFYNKGIAMREGIGKESTVQLGKQYTE